MGSCCKESCDGQLERFKARYVAKGLMEAEKLDFNETFAPTGKPETKRILLALGAQDDLVLHRMNVKSAFLNSSLAGTVYMEQPEGFNSGDRTAKCVCYNEVSPGCGRQEETGIRLRALSFLMKASLEAARTSVCS